MPLFSATRTHGLQYLAGAFAKAGNAAAGDCGPELQAGMGDFGLGPYLRHRIILEEEVIEAAQGAMGKRLAFETARQVNRFRRARGWLEQRPVLFRRYLSDRGSLEAAIERPGDLRRNFEAAVTARTGLACFDMWAKESVRNGYLEPHLRRMFASIWVFTLELPWQLGVAFFLRHLLDADAGECLLLWRSVAGAERGIAPYLVTAAEIEGAGGPRFSGIEGICRTRPEIEHEPVYEIDQAHNYVRRPKPGAAVLVVTCDDLHPESWGVAGCDVAGALFVEPFDVYEWYGERVLAFKRAALDDAMRRASQHFGCPVARISGNNLYDVRALRPAKDEELAHWLSGLATNSLVAMAPNPGPGADDLAAACQRLASASNPPRMTLLRRSEDAEFYHRDYAGLSWPGE